VTAMLDVIEMATGRRDLAPGADAALGIGLLGALGSAVTGLADWQYTVDLPRRTGLVHALLNTSATALYATSWLLRRSGRRGAGHATALLGYGIAAVSAYLGGDLVYKDRLGVNHAPEQTPPDKFTPLMADADLPEGGMKAAQVGEVMVMLARRNGTVYALANSCSHLGGPLAEGALEGDTVVCPWHSSRFRLADGSIVNGPATCPQPHYETRIRNGQIEVRNPPRQG
jgi:nitrite reductase/ring-hydroxylating ferredoxin subunit